MSQELIIDKDGNRFWYMYGKLHRGDDHPAIIKANGTMEWYRHGIRHREKYRPAIINPIGINYWYYNGTLMYKECARTVIKTARAVWDSLADNVKDPWDPNNTNYMEELLYEAQTRKDVNRAKQMTNHKS